jgi:poly(A) polymerase
VTFCDARGDVSRRDFTINALLWDPIEDRIHDWVGGREDLNRHLIRTVGDPVQRFEEDRLRMLRAVRFACQLGFEIEPQTWQAIRLMSPLAASVSGERIRAEMEGLLTSDRRAHGLHLLQESGLLRSLFPELEATVGIPQPPDKHPEGDVWTHTRLAVQNLESPSFEVALATLLHDAGKPMAMFYMDRIRFNRHEVDGAILAERICRRMKLSRNQIRRIRWLVGSHMMHRNIMQMKRSTLARFLREPGIDDLQALHRADMLGGSGDLSNHRFVEEQLALLESEPSKPQRLITGDDLRKLGVAPGPAMGRLLRRIENARLEGRLQTREEALSWVRGILRPRR